MRCIKKLSLMYTANGTLAGSLVREYTN